MVLRGNFYDGVTPKPHIADLAIENNHLIIKLLHSDKKIEWNSDEVEYTDYDSGLVNFSYTNSKGDIETFEFKTKNQSDLAKIRKAFYSYKKDIVSKMLFHNNKVIIPVAVFIVVFVLLSYFFIIPELSERLSTYIPPAVEIELGEGIKKSILEGEKIDSAKTKKLQEYFNSLNFKSNYDYQLYVYIDSNEVNAFALPGGTIFIASGLFDKIESYPMLTALIFHEASHVENKHTLKSLFRTLSRSVFLSLVFGDVNGMISFVSENANQIYSLNYSRELELEADKFASDEMRKRNIDQNGLISLFELLKENDIEIPKFLNTHPLTKDRLNNARKAKKNYPQYVTDTILTLKFNQIKS